MPRVNRSRRSGRSGGGLDVPALALARPATTARHVARLTARVRHPLAALAAGDAPRAGLGMTVGAVGLLDEAMSFGLRRREISRDHRHAFNLPGSAVPPVDEHRLDREAS